MCCLGVPRQEVIYFFSGAKLGSWGGGVIISCFLPKTESCAFSLFLSPTMLAATHTYIPESVFLAAEIVSFPPRTCNTEPKGNQQKKKGQRSTIFHETGSIQTAFQLFQVNVIREKHRRCDLELRTGLGGGGVGRGIGEQRVVVVAGDQGGQVGRAGQAYRDPVIFEVEASFVLPPEGGGLRVATRRLTLQAGCLTHRHHHVLGVLPEVVPQHCTKIAKIRRVKEKRGGQGGLHLFPNNKVILRLSCR